MAMIQKKGVGAMSMKVCCKRFVGTVTGGAIIILLILATADRYATAGPIEGSPRRGGKLILAITTDPSTLNCGVESSQIVAVVTSSLYSGLVHLDEKSDPHPDLARSWDISDNGLVYTFHLRDNVKWNDGEPLTSADVKFSLENLVGKYNARGRQAYRNIKTIEAPDPQTIVITLKKPYSPFLEILNVHDGCIMPKHIYEGTNVLTNPRNIDNPVGSGPFKLKEWVKGSYITLVRNEHYFKKGRPFLDSIIFRIIPNASTRATAFETGEVNAIIGSQSFPFQHTDRLKKLPNVILKDIGSPSMIGVNFNLKGNPVLAKKEVRAAIAHAIDKRFVVEKGMRGVGKVIDSVIPPGIPWAYNPNVPKYEFDVKKANALLDGAGYPRGASGMRFSLGLSYEAGNDNSERPAQIIREQLKAVGIEVKLERLERSVMLDKVFKKYDFDMWFGPLTTRGHPALGVARLFTTSSITGRPFTNFTRYSNPKVDQLFDLAVATTKKDEMVKAYHEVQDIIARDLPAIPVADRVQLNIISSDFRGALVSPETYERMDEIWWTKGTPIKDGDFDRDS
jgi:peptide/nickel transport system substrate-binding protein